MAYAVVVSRAAGKQIDKLEAIARSRVIRTLEILSASPRPPKALKLAGRDNQWRVRTGDYRIIYEVRDDKLLILVIKVGHRKEVYR